MPASAVADLLAEPTVQARLAHLRGQGLADESGLSWVLDRVEELVHGEPVAAVELTELCEAAAGPLASIRARAHYLRARVHAERGELDTALSLIGDARALWWQAGERLPALRTDLGRMHVLDDLGRHTEAVEVGEALIAALDAVAPDDLGEAGGWLRAAALDNLGVACGFIGQHERALEAYVRAETAYLALGMPEETGRPLANRGIELLELGRPREALDVLRRAAAVFTEAGDRLWSAKCLGDIAQAHQHLGEYVEALRLLESARATLDELGADAEAARLRLATAGVYLAIGLFPEATAEAAAAAGQTTATGMAHDAATARFTMALAALGAGDPQRAAVELQAAEELFERVGDRQGGARVLLADAEVLLAMGRTRAAADTAARAVAALRVGGWQIPLTLALLRLADLTGAAEPLQEATELAMRLQLPQLHHPCDLRAARLHRREGRTAEAEALLRAAVERVERLGDRLPDHALRTAFRADRLAAHDELVDLLVARGGPGDIADACAIGDRAKAATLLDLVTGTVGARRDPGHGSRPGSALGDVELDRHLADLNATYGALFTGTEPARRELLRRRADDLERQLGALLLRTAVADAPAGPALARTAAAPDATATLAYHIVGDDLVTFVLADGRITARRLAGVMPAVHAETDRLAAQWTRFQLGSSFSRRHQATLLDTTRQVLAALYGLLLAPLEDLLTDLPGDHLVIVPHRRLHQVPFHALHDGTGYLVERCAVTIAPTVTGATAGTRMPPGGALVLGVPDSHTPAVAAEVRAVGAALPGATVLLGAAATSEALASAVPGPGLLHIACHGLYRAANPLFSSLRLADRWVTATEILQLDLGGALVTLSACESGRHAGGTAEPLGLAWAFLAAGASGAVVSQWLVSDEATAELMADLLDRLGTGTNPAQALRQAQLHTAARHPHPYHWAPFTYVAAPHRPDRSSS